MAKYLEKKDIQPINKNVLVEYDDSELPEWFFRNLEKLRRKKNLERLKQKRPDDC